MMCTSFKLYRRTKKKGRNSAKEMADYRQSIHFTPKHPGFEIFLSKRKVFLNQLLARLTCF